MGTRSVTYVLDERQEAVVAMLVLYDGYPEGHGAELVDFLRGRRIVNGIPLNGAGIKVSNGLWELAAHMVVAFKAESMEGGVYLANPTKSPQDLGADYAYYITVQGEATALAIVECRTSKSWCGNPEAFLQAPTPLFG